jgi:hypothetical protein
MTTEVAAMLREVTAMTIIVITKRVYESHATGFRVSAFQLVSPCFRCLLITPGRTGDSGLVNEFANRFRQRIAEVLACSDSPIRRLAIGTGQSKELTS